MSEAKKEAERLVKLFKTKQCALIHVNEIIKTTYWYAEMKMLTNWSNAVKFHEEVKQELEKL